MVTPKQNEIKLVRVFRRGCLHETLCCGLVLKNELVTQRFCAKRYNSFYQNLSVLDKESKSHDQLLPER